MYVSIPLKERNFKYTTPGTRRCDINILNLPAKCRAAMRSDACAVHATALCRAVQSLLK